MIVFVLDAVQNKGDVKVGKDKSWKLETILKIDDNQFKTPKHDEMCLWVDKNIRKIINDFYVGDIKTVTLRWEEPLKLPRNHYVIGIPDFLFTARINNGDYANTLCGLIEVKPQINSIGETMRQLKLYKTHIESLDRNWVATNIFKFVCSVPYYFDCYLITKTNGYNDVFEKQNIHYFILTDEMMNNGKK